VRVFVSERLAPLSAAGYQRMIPALARPPAAYASEASVVGGSWSSACFATSEAAHASTTWKTLTPSAEPPSGSDKSDKEQQSPSRWLR
jgi:hypothetical protein